MSTTRADWEPAQRKIFFPAATTGNVFGSAASPDQRIVYVFAASASTSQTVTIKENGTTIGTLIVTATLGTTAFPIPGSGVLITNLSFTATGVVDVTVLTN